MLLALVALGALVLAAPAAAGSGQEASISQGCNAGGSDFDDGSNGSGDDSGSSSSCSNQNRVVQQSAGGDVSRSINQSQSFGDDDGDDDRVRVRSDRDEEDFDDEEDVAVSEEDFTCGDFSSQADAQAVLDENSDDPFDLDDDGDGRACEGEFTQAVSGAPEGGVETGGGGTLAGGTSEPSALAGAARTIGPPLALALVAAGLIGLRRGRTT